MRSRSHPSLSVAALADRVGIARANACTRVEWLRSEGVVEGFSARVNPGRLGLGPVRGQAGQELPASVPARRASIQASTSGPLVSMTLPWWTPG